MNKYVKWAGITFGALIALGVIGNIVQPKRQRHRPPENTATPAPVAPQETQAAPQQPPAALSPAEQQAQTQAAIDALPSVTPIQLAEEYEANTVAADQKFKGHQFKVSGKITSIDTDFTGAPYIKLGGPNRFNEPQFEFDKSAIDQIAQLKKGMNITLICVGNGDIVKTPMSRECQILQLN